MENTIQYRGYEIEQFIGQFEVRVIIFDDGKPLNHLFHTIKEAKTWIDKGIDGNY